jgi:hypothetical protein
MSHRADVAGRSRHAGWHGPDSGVGPAMTTPLWEWSIAWDEGSRSVGLSATRHGAMGALSRALIYGRRPVTGQVVPMLLVEPLHGQSYYLRGWPRQTALFDGVIIRWR